MTARGRLSDGRKWSPQEWKDSGAQEQVEENLLASEFKEALADVKDFGPPPLLAAKPKAKVVDMPSQPITIEDLESGEVNEHNSEKPAPQEPASGSADASMDQAFQDLHMQNQILNASRKQRNKGWKRVAALGARIAEKK